MRCASPWVVMTARRAHLALSTADWKLSGVELPLWIAGAGPLRRDLEDSGAKVLGWVPHERMSSLYRSAAAVLMPSRWQEPFGIVGLEA